MMYLRHPICLLVVMAIGLTTVPVCGEEDSGGDPGKPVLLAHYMPWYSADESKGRWGWHWTMNHFDPQKSSNGQREIASVYYPMIGPYDSGDTDVIECQLLLMKRAGVDGVIVDWYGLTDANDYAELHRHTERLVRQAERLGMKFAICYEDQTISALQKMGRIGQADRVTHASEEIAWLARNWFTSPNYVKLNARPVLLSFGFDGLTDGEWKGCLETLDLPVAYFSEHRLRRDAGGGTVSVGAYDWPVPGEGLAAVKRFYQQSSQWEAAIPVVYPRFVDVYAQAKVRPSYGRVDDQNGQVFRQTLDMALKSGHPLIQIATWNDWGEGTQIEPSSEFGFRDLEHLQSARREHWDSEFDGKPADFEMVMRLYRERKNVPPVKAVVTRQKQLDRAASAIAAGKLSHARELLGSAER